MGETLFFIIIMDRVNIVLKLRLLKLVEWHLMISDRSETDWRRSSW